jgi:hydroxyacid-oxoacid transhydrogenase
MTETHHNYPPSPQAIMALEKETDLPFEVYDQVVAEPTEESWRDAVGWARKHDFSHFLAYYFIPFSAEHFP